MNRLVIGENRRICVCNREDGGMRSRINGVKNLEEGVNNERVNLK